MKVLDRRYELMTRAELEQTQLERLQSLLVRLKRNVRRYREQLGDVRVESLADLAKLPMTTPEDMAALVPRLMAAGVRIIGGCCGTTPPHLKAMAAAVARQRRRG